MLREPIIERFFHDLLDAAPMRDRGNPELI
jgi:hypothetical protein